MAGREKGGGGARVDELVGNVRRIVHDSNFELGEIMKWVNMNFACLLPSGIDEFKCPGSLSALNSANTER